MRKRWLRIKYPIQLFVVTVLLINCNSQTNKDSRTKSPIPSLDEVSGIWMSTDTMAIEPSIRNFRGQALLNRDMTSVSWFVSAPYSGGHHTGSLKINGETPEASLFRWYPYQALRKGNFNGLDIESATRMLVEQDAIMWEITLTNTKDSVISSEVDLDVIGYISQYKEGDWKWWYPMPDWNGNRSEGRDQKIEDMRKHITIDSLGADIGWPRDKEILNSEHFRANTENNTIYINDKNTPAVSAFSIVTKPDELKAVNSGGTASWSIKLAPGESKVIKYFLTYGDDTEIIKKNIDNWSINFDKSFARVKSDWEKKWKQIFTPDQSFISGCFPVLETDDELAKKVYYTGPLTMLYLLNTNLPEHERVYLTGGPRWGASTTFFWDIAIWSELWAVVDPDMMKEQIISWIKIDPNKFYGKDNYGGQGVGNGYSANYWCLYKIIRAYLVNSGDYVFLDETIGDKKVIEHLESYALNWENLSNYGKPGYIDETYKLADFGESAVNLLECVPTYVHIVPSFNIGYVWMMRETAKLHLQRGNQDKAEILESKADQMVENILELYAGNGAWYSLYPNNKKVEVRHVLDFIYFGKFLANDVTPQVKQEMMNFLNNELKTDLWMRAQSLQDIAAEHSDRPDHGPLGSFDGWIPEVMDAMTNMGYEEDALDFYHDIEPVTYEGCWAQARELWGDNKLNKSARVRIAERGWNNRESSSGIGISQVMLKNFFGFNPQINSSVIQENNTWPFSGKSKLHHVHYKGEYYRIEFQNKKPVMIKESQTN